MAMATVARRLVIRRRLPSFGRNPSPRILVLRSRMRGGEGHGIDLD
jgi:hypothetical protein